jgi:LacI family transcriptional regulator
MNKPVKLADIARKSKVSVSTVSLVLRDKPGIPPETRERVLNAAKALGYRPKRFPKPGDPPRPIGKLHSLGLVIKTEPDTPPTANPFYSQVLAGIEDACRRRKINLLYTTLPVDANNLPTETPRLLAENQVEGLLLVGAFVDETLAHMLAEKHLPVVLVDAYTRADQYDAVLSDNLRGAYQAVQFLLERGHRAIGCVGSCPDAYPSLRERRQGYTQALLDHGVTTTYFADCAVNAEAALKAVSALLTEQPDLTAIFGTNDEVAISAMRAAQAAGRRIPDDFAVVGFDDIDLAQHVTPPLTTMHVDKVGMGRLAVQLLANRIEFPEAERVVSIICPRLVKRGSA